MNDPLAMRGYDLHHDVEIAVAGHVCLDVIPTFQSEQSRDGAFFKPGSLLEVGNAIMATGGAVSNAGLALHKLGARVRLVGKIGNDVFGNAIIEAFEEHDIALGRSMIRSPHHATSYTVVLNPPGRDRMFLHCPGANDSFDPDDISDEHLKGVGLLHFGYPPLMRQIYVDGGSGLAGRLKEIVETGIFTSLDMAMPDPASDSGAVDWQLWLQNVLPTVDLFCPSIDEILAMLPDSSPQRHSGPPGLEQIRSCAQRLLDFGAGIVLLKLGEEGLYLRTGNRVPERLLAGSAKWINRELLAPCFKVNVAGTTGAGDTTVAGFLAGLVSGAGPEQAMTAGVATGACCVEASDATSTIPAWRELQHRIAAGWARRPVLLNLDGWQLKKDYNLWCGPAEVP